MLSLLFFYSNKARWQINLLFFSVQPTSVSYAIHGWSVHTVFAQVLFRSYSKLRFFITNKLWRLVHCFLGYADVPKLCVPFSRRMHCGWLHFIIYGCGSIVVHNFQSWGTTFVVRWSTEQRLYLFLKVKLPEQCLFFIFKTAPKL